ncbi:MAG TPA: flavodoxin-dependent (E)-4-hydroxy-3-methylbut-2-enyl-diphosphate synthase, partial [Cyclobacteriaceae bacterium]|nr:flavodoxin-dependent (E)-4-hydroxy-3-methylbut-2-enyl-diphosphate synthase [Cyclobacteriaceae bacterium]
LRICQDLNYHQIVLSMKASNPQVMVQAYRLLVQKLDEEKFKPYPLHLGVTEAGDGEDGRIKSSVGIGTLLEDGLGDTVRVSLTEEPEVEAPVAKIMVDRYTSRPNHAPIRAVGESPVDPFTYTRRATRETANLGGHHHVPRVVADLSRVDISEYKDLRSIGHFYLPEQDKWRMNDQGADYVYTGNKPIPFMLPNGLKEIRDYKTWRLSDDVNKLPLLTKGEYLAVGKKHAEINFVRVTLSDLDKTLLEKLHSDKSAVAVIETSNTHVMPELRRIFFELVEKQLDIPVLIFRAYPATDEDTLRIHAATDIGGLYIDGFGDGIILGIHDKLPKEDALRWVDICNKTSFGILQATRNRMSKTEYISCPSCGRTLFDLQETTAMIRKRTDHLKGVKIGIMGCIVNGPGEMADADYGY